MNLNVAHGVCKSINLKYIKSIKTNTVNNKTLYKTLFYDGIEYVVLTEWSLSLLNKFNPGDDLNLKSLGLKQTIDDQYMINYNSKNIEFEKLTYTQISKVENSIPKVSINSSFKNICDSNIFTDKKMITNFIAVIKEITKKVLNGRECLSILIADKLNTKYVASITCWLTAVELKSKCIYSFKNIITKQDDNNLIFSTGEILELSFNTLNVLKRNY